MTEDPADVRFWRSLKPGSLVATTVHSSRKVHIIQLTKVREPDKGDEKEKDFDPDWYLQYWMGDALCNPNWKPEYWWKPQKMDELMGTEQCPNCFNRWARRGRPLLAGDVPADKVAKKADPLAVPKNWELPVAWKLAEPAGFPADSVPLTEGIQKDDEEHSSTRKELVRWVRGDRYVRITEIIKDPDNLQPLKYTHELRHGFIDKPKKDQRSWRSASYLSLAKKAYEIMALGGSPA